MRKSWEECSQVLSGANVAARHITTIDRGER